MKDLSNVQSQLERALGTLMDAAEQQPDADLAEAVDHVSAALTRLRAAEDTEASDTPTGRPKTGVVPQAAHFERKNG
jgi:hypothetical protein